MAKRRATVKKQIKDKRDKIDELKSELEDLRIEEIQISDKYQQYTEEDREFTISLRPKKTEIRKVGIVTWREDFVDESTQEVVTVERSRIVKDNGVWIRYEFYN